MSAHFDKVTGFLNDLDLKIIETQEDQELVIVEDHENGISNLIIDCEHPILVLEQPVLITPENPGGLFKRLLQMNNDLVHGAYVLSQDGKLILWRDTLQLDNLDLNELEGSIKALSLGLAEHAAELLKFAKS